MDCFSDEDLIKFLDTMAEKSIIPKNTAHAQKVAVLKMLNVLTTEEKAQLQRDLDIESLNKRFMNATKHILSPESMKTYYSRFKTAFTGYIKWAENPGSFSPRQRLGRPQIRKLLPEENSEKKDLIIESLTPSYPPKISSIKFTIPISPDVFAHLDLPNKLSKAEACRINEFIAACIKST